jgi:hypothetical protein
MTAVRNQCLLPLYRLRACGQHVAHLNNDRRMAIKPGVNNDAPYTLDPCADCLKGGDDRKLYQKVGIPEEWIQRRLDCYGSISPREYFWTEDNAFRTWGAGPEMLGKIRDATGGSFFRLGLDKQCQLLDVPIRTVTKTEIGKEAGKAIEEAVLDWYRAQDWVGDRSEGAFFLGLNAYCRRRFDENFDDEAMTTEFMLSARYRRMLNWIPEMFASVSRDEVLKSKHFKLGMFRDPKLVRANARTYWDCVSKPQLDRLIAFIPSGQFTNGWPDLMLAHPATGKFQLVEVKQKGDSFTHRQAYWLRNIWRPLGWPFYVLKVE